MSGMDRGVAQCAHDDATKTVAHRSGESGSVSQKPGSKKVLIVEDEFLLALQEEQVLLAAGYEVAGLAADARTAVRLADETRPQLVLMDVRLNGSRDGVDAATEIWQRFGIRSLFITGNRETASSPRAAAANAVGVLSKPYRDDEIIQAVSQALRHN